MALVTLKVAAASTERVARDLATLPEVEHVYTTTGESITLKAGFERVHDIEPFLKWRVLRRPGFTLSSRPIITNVVKEELPSPAL